MIFLFYLSAQLRVSIQEVGSYIPGAVNCVRVLLTSTTLVIVRTGWISCRRPKTSKNSFYLMSAYVYICSYFLFIFLLKVISSSLILIFYLLLLYSLSSNIEDDPDHGEMASQVGVRPQSGVKQMRLSTTTPPEGSGHKRRRLLSTVSPEDQLSVSFLREQNKALLLHLEQIQKTVFVLTNAMVSKREADRVKKLESELNTLRSQFQSQIQLAAADVDYCLLHIDPSVRESVNSLLPSKNANGFS